MASNPPSSSGSGIQKKVLGLPLWAWGIGVAAFGIGIIVFLKSRSSAASNAYGSPQLPVPTGSASPTVYPFFMGQTSTGTSPADTSTSSTNFGTIVGKGFAGNIVPNTVPLYAIPGSDPSKPLDQQSVSWAPDKTTFNLTGSPVLGKWGTTLASFYPVIYQGQQYYVSQADTYPQNVSTGTGGGGYGMHNGTMPAALLK